MPEDPSDFVPHEAVSNFVRNVFHDARKEYEELGALPLVDFPRSVRLPRSKKGWHDIAYAVTMDGSLAIMRSDFDVRAAWAEVRDAGGNRGDLRLPSQARAALSVFDGTSDKEAMELPLLYPFPFFECLADGSWLVADNMAGKDKPNAALFSAGGALKMQLFLGSNIEQLQADADGGFWIGYGDYGIFGGPHGVEGGGVVRFNADGKPIWAMNSNDATRCHAWCDHSYALNISPAGRWAYTYTEFLLTRLDAEGGPRSLRPMITFADAVAVDGDRIMMAGGSWGRGGGHGYDRLALLGKPGRWTPRRPELSWMVTVRRAINPRERLWTARGNTLHCIRGKTWHRLSIDEADAFVSELLAGPPASHREHRSNLAADFASEVPGTGM